VRAGQRDKGLQHRDDLGSRREDARPARMGERPTISTTVQDVSGDDAAPRTDHSVQLDSRGAPAGVGHVIGAYADQVILQPPFEETCLAAMSSGHSRRAACVRP